MSSGHAHLLADASDGTGAGVFMITIGGFLLVLTLIGFVLAGVLGRRFSARPKGWVTSRAVVVSSNPAPTPGIAGTLSVRVMSAGANAPIAIVPTAGGVLPASGSVVPVYYDRSDPSAVQLATGAPGTGGAVLAGLARVLILVAGVLGSVVFIGIGVAILANR